MATKLCGCGCGQALSNRRGVRFRPGHGTGRGKKMVGDRRFRRYVHVYAPDHPLADDVGEVLEHRLIASNALGRPVPDGCPIHHVNGDKYDNRPANLVVCESHAYHELLHRRQRALDACGSAHWLRCVHCGAHDDPDNGLMWFDGARVHAWHRACHSRADAERRARKAAGIARCAYCRQNGEPSEMVKKRGGIMHHAWCKRSWSKSFSHHDVAGVS